MRSSVKVIQIVIGWLRVGMHYLITECDLIMLLYLNIYRRTFIMLPTLRILTGCITVDLPENPLAIDDDGDGYTEFENRGTFQVV